MQQQGYRIPLGEGRSRSVLVRPNDRGIVQFGIVSVYGNVLEAVGLDAELQGAVVGALALAREDADRNLLDGLAVAQVEAEARRHAAYALNPHLNGTYQREREARRRRRGVVA